MTLTHHHSARHFTPAGRRKAPALRRLLAMFTWLATVVVLWCQRERLRWELHRLCEDDHILKDIGLTRSDLFRAIRKPLWRQR